MFPPHKSALVPVEPDASQIFHQIAQNVLGSMAHQPVLFSLTYQLLITLRPTLIGMVQARLDARKGRLVSIGDLAELWGVRERTQANLDAIQLLATKRPQDMTLEDRRVLARYSGWGGLSIEAVKDRVPPGFPLPREEGLIHEYYTPSMVTDEAVRLLAPLLSSRQSPGGRITALEPSAGIGRFLQAYARQAEKSPLPTAHWTAVELSPLSAQLLRALFPAVEVHQTSFESFINHLNNDTRYDLILANPPYGPRGMHLTEDPDAHYRVKSAYLYFMLRGVELLKPDGLAVFLVPSGFMSAVSYAQYRERVFRAAHLLDAFRLPSESVDNRELLFPGANIVTDLIFLQGRGGVLLGTPESDQGLVQGAFFEQNPHRILGTEQKVGEHNEEHNRNPRKRYSVIGAFRGLPPLMPRPMERGMTLQAFARRSGVNKSFIAQDVSFAGLPPQLRQAIELGYRVERYLEQLQQQNVREATTAWGELKRDLEAFARNQNPSRNVELYQLANKGVRGAQRLLAVFGPDGSLLPTIAEAPKIQERYEGAPELPRHADWLYRQYGDLTLATLVTEWHGLSGQLINREQILAQLIPLGWCLDGPEWNQLRREEDYYTGHLWTRVDLCNAPHTHKPVQLAEAQLTRLLQAIKPVIWADIAETTSPRDSWVPLDIITAFWNAAFKRHDVLVLDEAMVTIQGHSFERVIKEYAVPLEQVELDFLSWINKYTATFRPQREMTQVDGISVKELLDEARARQEEEFKSQWNAWLADKPEYQESLTNAYNRNNRGYVAPTHPETVLPIARWGTSVKLHSYQNAGARRLVHNRRGLLAFDVGVGKTYTGIAVMAYARQEGWARRPVIVVPNTIVWKWVRDIHRCLPDYRVLVIGAERYTSTRGERRGRAVSRVDTPEERAQKWTQFQAGLADCVVLTYNALGRQQMAENVVDAYVNKFADIRRSIQLGATRKTVTNKKTKKGIQYDRTMRADDPELYEQETERQRSVRTERVKAWLAEKLEAPEDQRYDPGIEWHNLGIDFLMVDEAQNFKNLFGPEPRIGGIPGAMGSTQFSKRAWQLDLRCDSVREHSRGAGVFLLSATPAKNGPLEFYNALHLIDPYIWTSAGIRDPESFIDSFCGFDKRIVQTADGKLKVKATCTRFVNLDNLRHIINRYADFKTAEDVGLQIPEAEAIQHRVPLNAVQRELIANKWDEIRRSSGQRQNAVKMMGLAVLVDLIAIHPALVEHADQTETSNWVMNLLQGDDEDEEEAAQAQTPASVVDAQDINPHAPKIDAVVAEILKTDAKACPRTDPEWCLNCGHVVFVENLLAHDFLKRCLVEAGIPAERIAILSAKAAKDSEKRVQIADAFNGYGEPGSEDFVAPQFDIVIANAVAYEGIDLQRRTCAIHHLDLPWDPATLQQRNGRGVRQGNTFNRVKIHYYFGTPSCDGRKLSAISNKRSWLISLLKSHDRTTNNPASGEINIFDLLLDIVPENERAMIIAQRDEELRKLEAAKRSAIQRTGQKLLQKIQSRMLLIRADQSRDNLRQTGLTARSQVWLEEAQKLLTEARDLDPEVWPNLRFAGMLLNGIDMLIPDSGRPLIAAKSYVRDGYSIETGRVKVLGDRISGMGVRGGTDSIVWEYLTPSDYQSRGILTIKPDDLSDANERDDLLRPFTRDAIRRIFEARTQERYYGNDHLVGLNWKAAPNAWVERYWPHIEDLISAFINRRPEVAESLPFAGNGWIGIASLQDDIRQFNRQGRLLPPTDAAFVRFVELAKNTDYAWGTLNKTALDWWGREFPKGVVSAAQAARREAERRARQAESAAGDNPATPTPATNEQALRAHHRRMRRA